MCVFLRIEHSASDLFYNYFPKAERMHAAFEKWPEIVIETHPEHCK